MRGMALRHKTNKYWTEENVDLMLALDEKLGGSPMLLQLFLWVTSMFMNFMGICPEVVEIF